MHLGHPGVPRQYLLERVHLVECALAGGKANRQRPIGRQVGKVGHDEILGDQTDPIILNADPGPDEHHRVVSYLRADQLIGLLEEHHLDAAGEIFQLC